VICVETGLGLYLAFCDCTTRAPYILELGRNVSSHGVPTLRPLWYEFPADAAASEPDCEDQFLLGPKYLAAPVTVHGAVSRSVYFPGDASVGWKEVAAMGGTEGVVHKGGERKVIQAPLEKLPLFERV
jgi:alpha-D-xyloside xylohydrolase